MNSCKNLKLLSSIIILIAWLELIASIIVTTYLIYEKTSFLTILPFVIGGFIGFVFFLSFGKSIQLLIDIRVSQKDDSLKTKIRSESSSTLSKTEKNKIDEGILILLNESINYQKRSFLGKGHKSNIIEILNEIVISKEKGLELITGYNKMFEKDLLNDLKHLSTNYNAIENYLSCFIEYGIVKKEYPHDLDLM